MTAPGRQLESFRTTLAESGPGAARPAWLRAAYADPAAFWEQAAPELIAEAPGVPRSAVFQWYNLFHELGARHAVGSRPALQDYSPGRGFRAESYEAVVRRARALASAWQREGVLPGSAVCLVLDVSAAYLACALAAFCCGATLTVLPPDGPSFVQRALAALASVAKPPEVFVVTGTAARPWVESQESVQLLEWESLPALDALPLEPYRYDAADVAVRLFSPLGADWDTPVELSAEQLYLSALRDGLLVFGLGPGEGIAAPGFCEVQLAPGLVFAALAAGATWVQLSADELEDGRALFQGNISVLGVTAPLRRLLSLGKPPPSGRIKRWFKNLAEDNAAKAWASFEGRMKAAGARGMSWFGNSAAGGSILFSTWSNEPSSAGVYRVPGLPCELSEPNGTGMPALADVGMLSPLAKIEKTKGVQQGLPAQALGQLVIVETEASDLWVTNLGSHRRAVVLPERQIEAVLQAAFEGAVRAAVLVVLPLVGESGQRVALLVYARPGACLASGELREVLLAELGAERVPDQIEVFELNPKLLDGKKDTTTVDRDACRTEYLSGMAWRKSRCPVFWQLAALSGEVDAVRNHRREAEAMERA